MSEAGFTLDPRLAADSRHVAMLPLCELRLMDDTRFPWLLLVPRRAGLAEVTDLAGDEQQQLWHEANRASAALRA
ncbi:MAG: HIT domain-containing protein, partial [Xanthomonadaceae bacterium]|nr:HIT domain-containing protein [Xanthomonadaceae bacterium]